MMELDPRLRADRTTNEQAIEVNSVYPPASEASAAPAPYTLSPAFDSQPASLEHHRNTLAQPPHSSLPYYAAQHDSLRGVQQIEQVADMHADLDLTSDQLQGDPDTPKRPRACEACRGLKVRCDFELDAEVCKRCSKANRECTVTAPNRRRPKKTDNRVADLEKRIDDLTASLEEQKRQSGGHRRYSPEVEHDGDGFHAGYVSTHRAEPTRKKHKLSHGKDEEQVSPAQPGRSLSFHRFTDMNTTAMRPLPPLAPGTPLINNEYSDVIDRGVLTNAIAIQLFEHYTNNMQNQLPCVVFPPQITAGRIRKSKPILFLAILSIASAHDFPDLHRILNRELSKSLADRIIVKREKSLELIQAMQIVAAWHNSEDSDDTMAFQFIQMASAMAIAHELSGPPSRSLGSKHPNRKFPPFDENERKRAWLSCYLLNGCSSFPLRQHNSIRWTTFLDDCLSTLQSSPEASPSDKLLSKWVELQRLCDKILELSIVTRSNGSQALEVIKEMQSIMEKIRIISSGLEANSNFSLKLASHEIETICWLTIAKIGDIANYSVYSRPDEGGSQVLTEAFTGSVRSCVGSIHNLLDQFTLFLEQGAPAELNCFPSLHISRIAYALISLLCVYFGVSSPKSKLKKFLGTEDIHVDDYLSRLLVLLRSSSADETGRPAQKLQLIIKMLKTWYERIKNGRRSPISSEQGVVDTTQIRPVDEERNTPRLGYRKLSVHGSNLSGEEAGPVPPSPSSRIPNAERTQLHLPGQILQPGNTPLDLLSQVATNAPSAHATNGPGGEWYGQSTSYRLPQPESNHAGDGGQQADQRAGWAGIVLDPALEEAMGMVFGSEGNMFGSFVDDLVSGIEGQMEELPNWLAEPHRASGL